MGIVFWICAISVVCIIAGVIFYKPYLGVVFVIISIPLEGFINPNYIGWSTYSHGSPVAWPWGLTEESHTGKNGIYLRQLDEDRGYWLYTGSGVIKRAPSWNFDRSFEVPEDPSSRYRISCYLKGKGFADLYVWWFDETGKSNSEHLVRYDLPGEYKELRKEFGLPSEARKYRIAFLLRKTDGDVQSIYVDDFVLERTVGEGEDDGMEVGKKVDEKWHSVMDSDFELTDPSEIFGILIYPLEAVLSILVFICVVKLVMRRVNYFRNTKLIFYYLPFIFCILLSALKFMEFSFTVKEIVRWLELFLIYYLTINLINDDRKVRVILYSMVLTTAIVSIQGIINYLSIDWGRSAFAFFGNPNPFAGYINLIIPVLFGMLMAGVLLWERITLGILIIPSIVAWFLAFSRSAWLFLILTIILVFFLTKVKKRITLLLLVTLFAILAITSLSSNIKERFMGKLSHNALDSLEDRIMCYPIGFNMVKDDLIFGIGVGNYPLIVKKFTIDTEFKQTNLHNLYLQVFVEAGLMGLCTFVFWLVCVVKYLVSSLKAVENTGNYSLFVGLMGGVIVYLFNNLAEVLTVHGIHLQWGIILGLAVVLTQFRESEG
jgi:Lipid A core - O-antigen ligase and related enzymes